MKQFRRQSLAVTAGICLLLIPMRAAAQTGSSGIAGVVKDSSGAVLPGVTVEASSPALIGGARATVTDELGLYRIVFQGPQGPGQCPPRRARPSHGPRRGCVGG